MTPVPAISGRSAFVDVRLVPAALTSWTVTAAGILWPVGRVLAAAGLVLIVGSGALLWYSERRPKRTPGARVIGTGLVAIGVVATGFGFAIALRADAVGHHPLTAAFGAVASVTVTPTESAVPAGRGRLLFHARLQNVGADEMSGRVVVFGRQPDFGEVMVGRPLRFAARISRPKRHDLTVAVLNGTGQPTMGRTGLLARAAHCVRSRFAAAAREVLPGDQAAMLAALVLGDTSTVSAVTDREFRAAGMTHLTAVSGANVTIVCGAVLASARLIGPRAAVGLAVVALVVFVIVVQPTASVLRAAVMGGIALMGILSSRRRQAVPALSATVLVLMAIAPQMAVEIGFALSVVATAALVVIAPVWSGRMVARGWPKPLADALAVAWAAQLVTAPLIAGLSGRFSVVAGAANLAVTAVIAPITVLGSAAAALCLPWPTGAHLLIRFTGPELWWVLRVAHWAAGVPGATVPVPAGLPGLLIVSGSAVLVVVLWRWWWFRVAMGSAMAAAIGCLLAWWLSGRLAGPGWSPGFSQGESAIRDTIMG